MTPPVLNQRQNDSVKLITRDHSPRIQWQLEQAGIPPLLAQLYAARGITNTTAVDTNLKQLLPPNTLKGAQQAANLLANALTENKKICIVADYDCDGATACAVGLRGLKMLGFQDTQLTYIVPDRIQDGYGLTPAIADRVKTTGADILLTVDNGIASIAGVEHANALGLQVIVTDHHLPALIDNEPQLPAASAIVNPNQPGCTFASQSIAGVGVMFYVLVTLRSELRSRELFNAQTQPRLDALLDLVALGTVADVVILDDNNRRLVTQGLQRIRKGQMHPGVAALYQVAGRNANNANTFDMGFALGPRLNAAGRLSDMTLGIECLLTDDTQVATQLAKTLDQINHERKAIEADMLDRSVILLEKHLATHEATSSDSTLPTAMSIFDEEFHEGVVGILASRLKEKFYRPAFVFAPSLASEQQNIIKGSGRSINGFHLRDALDLMEKRHPGLLLKFGGHAMAAGCTLQAKDFPLFESAFAEIAKELLDPKLLAKELETDGALPPQYCTPETAKLLRDSVWGNGFPAPIFSESLQILSQRIVGEKHMALKLRYHNQTMDGIWFNHTTPLPEHPTIAYRLDIDEWQGVERIKFVIEGMQEST